MQNQRDLSEQRVTSKTLNTKAFESAVLDIIRKDFSLLLAKVDNGPSCNEFYTEDSEDAETVDSSEEIDVNNATADEIFTRMREMITNNIADNPDLPQDLAHLLFLNDVAKHFVSCGEIISDNGIDSNWRYVSRFVSDLDNLMSYMGSHEVVVNVKDVQRRLMGMLDDQCESVLSKLIRGILTGIPTFKSVFGHLSQFKIGGLPTVFDRKTFESLPVISEDNITNTKPVGIKKTRYRRISALGTLLLASKRESVAVHTIKLSSGSKAIAQHNNQLRVFSHFYKHPSNYIVRCFGARADDEIVLEHTEVGSLSGIVGRRNDRVNFHNPKQRWTFIVDTFKAIAVVHEAGFCHRRLGLKNFRVFAVEGSFHLKLCGFDYAAALGVRAEQRPSLAASQANQVPINTAEMSMQELYQLEVEGKLNDALCGLLNNQSFQPITGIVQTHTLNPSHYLYNYLAPELVNGEEEVFEDPLNSEQLFRRTVYINSFASDVYAGGVMILEIATRSRVSERISDPQKTLKSKGQSSPLKGLGKLLCAQIESCLHDVKDQRPSAEDVATDLENMDPEQELDIASLTSM